MYILVKTICKGCGKKIDANSLFCTHCGTKNREASDAIVLLHSKGKRHRKRALLYGLGAFVLFIIFIIVLNINLLLPWQKEARLNKSAIISYVTEHYPDATIIKQQYESLNPNFLKSYSSDYITFKKDLLVFSIFAKGGEVIIDNYPKEKSIAKFEEIIQDGFLKPRGIVAQTQYRFLDNYETYPYTGGLSVTLRISNQGATPQEIGWLYDFYIYWKKNSTFLKSYRVYIDIVTDNDHHTIRYLNTSEFATEEEFYAIFK